jgi:hypothetical protein
MFLILFGLYALVLGILQIYFTYKEIKKTEKDDDDNTLFVKIAHWSSVTMGGIMTMMGLLVII